MRLKITHRTDYTYDGPVQYALQRLRLAPAASQTQKVTSWSLTYEGVKEEVRFTDAYGNDTRLVSVNGESSVISVLAQGEVQTTDTVGVIGEHHGLAPLWLFQQETPLTLAGEGVSEIAASIGAGEDIPRLHSLMDTIAGRIAYVQGSTGTTTTAEEAIAQGSGVCQDHAHIFAACARKLGFPARYVSGYLMMDDTVDQAASHAWAEAYVPAIGWIAFDPANAMSPDERYVRIAAGRDYREAMPVSGIRLGLAEERLAVSVTVEQ